MYLNNRIRKVFLCAMICLAGFLRTPAQSLILGTVGNAEKSTVEYATVVLMNPTDSTIIQSAFSDSSGRFALQPAQPTLKTYLLKVIALQYQDTSLIIDSATWAKPLSITLKRQTNALKEVAVTSRYPVIQRKIDRLVFTPSSLISSTGSNAYDLLKKAPFVTADENGTIAIRGLAGAGVLINERLMSLSGNALMDYLKSIPADEVKSIEIITNPPSKYDAAGLSGLINIVLNKNSREGFNGNINLTYLQTQLPKYGINADLNYRNRRWNIFGGLSVSPEKYTSIEQVDNIYNRDVSPYYYYETGNRTRDVLSGFGKFGADYTINSKQVLGCRVEASESDKTGTELNTGIFGKTPYSIDSIYKSTITSESKTRFLAVNLNYAVTLDSLGQSWSTDLDFSSYNQPLMRTTNYTQILNNQQLLIGPDITFSNSATQQIQIYSIKTDYSKPLSKSLLVECGAKYYSLDTRNQLVFSNWNSSAWIIDTARSNNFNYQESNAAAYVDARKEFNSKWSAQAGVRGEYTQVSGNSSHSDQNSVSLNQQVFRLFPTLFVQYNRNENHQFSFNYSERISRPDYMNLDPFRYYTNPSSYIEGNPFLRPALTSSFDLSYTLKQRFHFNAFYYNTQGQITQVPVLAETENSYKYLSINLDHSYNAGINAYASTQLKPWWEIIGSLTAGMNGVRSVINNLMYTYENFNVMLVTNSQFTLSRTHQWYGELNLMYQPAGASQGLFILGRMLDLSSGIKKTFKDNRSALTINFVDMLNSAYITAKVDNTQQYSFLHGNYDKRGVRFSFTYKFGNRALQKARDKNSGIEEEKSRIK